MLAGLRILRDEEEIRGKDTFQNPDERGPRLSVNSKEEQNVEKIYTLPALPSPLPSEMPSSWWRPLLFGKPGDALSQEDARLALALIEARLQEHPG